MSALGSLLRPRLWHEIVLLSFHLCTLGVFKTLRGRAVILLLEITEEHLRLLFSAPSGFPFLQLRGAARRGAFELALLLKKSPRKTRCAFLVETCCLHTLLQRPSESSAKDPGTSLSQLPTFTGRTGSCWLYGESWRSLKFVRWFVVRVVGAQGISPAFAAQTNLLCAHIHQFDLNDRPLTSRRAQAGLWLGSFSR